MALTKRATDNHCYITPWKFKQVEYLINYVKLDSHHFEVLYMCSWLEYDFNLELGEPKPLSGILLPFQTSEKHWQQARTSTHQGEDDNHLYFFIGKYMGHSDSNGSCTCHWSKIVLTVQSQSYGWKPHLWSPTSGFNRFIRHQTVRRSQRSSHHPFLSLTPNHAHNEDKQCHQHTVWTEAPFPQSSNHVSMTRFPTVTP